MNNLEITKKIFKIFKKLKLPIKSKILFVKDRPGHDKRYALDSNKIFNQLKWRKKINIDNGLYKTVLWYINNKKYFKTLNKKDIINRFGKK